MKTNEFILDLQSVGLADIDVAGGKNALARGNAPQPHRDGYPHTRRVRDHGKRLPGNLSASIT